MQEASSLPPSDAPEREKQLEGERWRQMPPTPAAQLSEALPASDKHSCKVFPVVRVVEVQGERREGGMMEDASAGAMPGLQCPAAGLTAPLLAVCWPVLVGIFTVLIFLEN